MDSQPLLSRVLAGLGAALLQLLTANIVTFLVSIVFPGLRPEVQPTVFAASVGLCFSAGIFLAGWLAVKWEWLPGEARLPARLVATLIGAYLPLAVALSLGAVREGSPFFFASMLAGIIGFGAVGWVGRRR